MWQRCEYNLVGSMPLLVLDESSATIKRATCFEKNHCFLQSWVPCATMPYHSSCWLPIVSNTFHSPRLLAKTMSLDQCCLQSQTRQYLAYSPEFWQFLPWFTRQSGFACGTDRLRAPTFGIHGLLAYDVFFLPDSCSSTSRTSGIWDQ